jgi:hypothetical protein
VIGAEGIVLLQAKFDESDVGGDFSDIREIIVGGPAGPVGMNQSNDRRTVDMERYQALSTRRPWRERVWDVLRAVMSTETDVEELMQSIPDGAQLEVSVHIGYKARKRDISRAPMQRALRNLPEGDLTAKGKDGRLTGRDIRLSHPTTVVKTGSLIIPSAAEQAFLETYKFLGETGKIEP